MTWVWWWLAGWIAGVMGAGLVFLGVFWLREKLANYRAWKQACKDEDRRSCDCRQDYMDQHLYGIRVRRGKIARRRS